jgi:glycosyltransferase involved in cell wall biosynthesis
MVYVQEVLDMMRACVLIPVYNESANIGRVVKEIREQNLDVLVVDDGSQDNSSEIAGESGAVVIVNGKNQGKGSSLKTGFKYVLDKGYGVVITMDGDGQHLPQDIPYFLRIAEYSDAQIFIGNRMQKTKTMPFVRIMTNRFMSWLISCVAGQKIPDTQCGFRLIKKAVLEKVKLSTERFEVESEILINGSRLGFKIESVPIKTVYRGEKSQINPFVDTLRFIRFMFKVLWKQ